MGRRRWKPLENTTISLETEKIPPQNLDAERALLGAVLLEGAPALERVAGRLRPEDFYSERHRTLFRRLVAMTETEQRIDLVTAADALRETMELADIGGPAALAQLVDDAAVLMNLEDYMRIVLREAGKREAIRALTEAISQVAGNGTGPAAIAIQTTDLLAKIAERTDPDAFRESTQRLPAWIPIATVMEQTQIDLRFGIVDLVPSHVAFLNERFAGGFKRQEFVIFGSAPGIGKSAFVAEWARYAAARGHRVGIITMEMSNQDFGERLLVQAGPVSATALRKREIDASDWQRIDQVIPELAGLPIEFSDEVTHVTQIGRMLRSRAERGEPPFRLAFVDYLQLLDAPRAQARYQEVGMIGKLLKRYAKRYDLTMVAVSSFTPGPPEKGKARTRPSMRNLRESRDLDHHADAIILMWTPKVGSTDRELIIDKGRSGQIGATTLAFTGQYLTFQEHP